MGNKNPNNLCVIVLVSGTYNLYILKDYIYYVKGKLTAAPNRIENFNITSAKQLSISRNSFLSCQRAFSEFQ